ncbi:MAG: hypothetical protein COB84_06350 [Rhodobacteraceae bacterium]|nr:MAG: hypothetical protein COB84_06350 [Paracoccaceae bacterium]
MKPASILDALFVRAFFFGKHLILQGVFLFLSQSVIGKASSIFRAEHRITERLIMYITAPDPITNEWFDRFKVNNSPCFTKKHLFKGQQAQIRLVKSKWRDNRCFGKWQHTALLLCRISHL